MGVVASWNQWMCVSFPRKIYAPSHCTYCEIKSKLTFVRETCHGRCTGIKLSCYNVIFLYNFSVLVLACQLVHMLSSGGNWVTGHQPHVGLALLNYCAWGSEQGRVLTLLSQEVLVLGDFGGNSSEIVWRNIPLPASATEVLVLKWHLVRSGLAPSQRVNPESLAGTSQTQSTQNGKTCSWFVGHQLFRGWCPEFSDSKGG